MITVVVRAGFREPRNEMAVTIIEVKWAVKKLLIRLSSWNGDVVLNTQHNDSTCSCRINDTSVVHSYHMTETLL